MKKIRFFFLQILFLFTPLIYAWLYMPGVGFDISSLVHRVFSGITWSGFESVKVTFFLFCMTGALLAHFISLFFEKKVRISRIFIISLSVFFLWTALSLWVNLGINTYFAFGNPEKHHGWFFYAALFGVFFLLRALSPQERKKLMNLSFIGFAGVLIYALFQKMGLDPLTPFYETRLNMARAFSTLGNPNYLAGLVLMMLPLLHETMFTHKGEQKALWDILLWIVGGCLIYWTGSYLAWIFFFLYVLVIIVQHIFPRKKHQFIFWILVGL